MMYNNQVGPKLDTVYLAALRFGPKSVAHLSRLGINGTQNSNHFNQDPIAITIFELASNSRLN